MGPVKIVYGIIKKIIKFIAILFAIAIIIALLVVMLPVIIAAVTTAVPALIAVVQWLIGIVMKVIKPVLDLLKPAFDALKNVYDNWVKPVLTKVQGAVDALRDSVYKVYNLTIGGVVTTYNNLFGWVDGLQVQFNGTVDRLVGLIGIVSQKTADKLDAMRQDVNRTIDKYTSDIFDKVLKMINQAVGPVLTAVSELAAAVNEKLQHALDLGEKASNYADILARKSESADVDAGPVVLYTEERGDQAYEDNLADLEKPPPAAPKGKTVWDVMFAGWLPYVEKEIVSLMEDAEKTIDANIEEIYNDTYNLKTLFSKDVEDLKEGEAFDDLARIFIGDMSLVEYIRVHWKEIVKGMIWGQDKVLTPQDDEYWTNRFSELRKQGVARKKAMIQVDQERAAIGKPAMFGAPTTPPERGF